MTAGLETGHFLSLHYLRQQASIHDTCNSPDFAMPGRRTRSLGRLMHGSGLCSAEI